MNDCGKLDCRKLTVAANAVVARLTYGRVIVVGGKVRLVFAIPEIGARPETAVNIISNRSDGHNPTECEPKVGAAMGHVD